MDWYDVLLEDQAGSEAGRSTRVTGTAALESGFSGLTPGTRYTLGVVATSGNKSSPAVWRDTATGQSDPLFNKHQSGCNDGVMGIIVRDNDGNRSLLLLLIFELFELNTSGMFEMTQI